MYNKKDEIFRSFNISMPSELIPIYNFLQNEMNFILSNEEMRSRLLSIDISQRKGKVWMDMNVSFKERIETWNIHNKAWHARILFENLRRLLFSLKDKQIIWNEYLKNNKQINKDLFNILVEKHKIYATTGLIKNIAYADKEPEIPYFATFILDYSVSDKQMFYADSNNLWLFHIKVSEKDWFSYEIIVPTSVREEFNGKIAKPRFFLRRSDNKYIGLCSYEINPHKNNNENILGVDIGKVNPYSAVVLNSNGDISEQLLPSNLLFTNAKKLNNLRKERNFLYKKIKKADQYYTDNIISKKQRRRIKNYKKVRNKISRLNNSIAKLIASEVVYLAQKYNCKEIHVENLSWLESKGGKWNHSNIFMEIENAAEIYGISVFKINPKNSSKENPWTKEIGKEKDRNIIFKDLIIDRDYLATINLSIRNKGKDKERNKINKKYSKNKLKTKKEISRKQRIKNKVNKVKKGKSQIVIFRHDEVLQTIMVAVDYSIRQIANNSLILRYKDLVQINVS